MILWQKRTLVPAANVGQPGPLPPPLRGLSNASLADLPAALNPDAVAALGLANTGYLPVITNDVPEFVSRLQFITALQNMGAYATVAAQVQSIPVTHAVSIYFLNTTTFSRHDQRMLDFISWAGYSAAQADAVFIAAGNLPA